eukprot:2805708-Pyramimonas_sp.AAC.1
MPTFPGDERGPPAVGTQRGQHHSGPGYPETKWSKTGEEGKGGNASGKGVAGMAARAAGAVGSALFG